ncbi:MAG TPA: zinc ribbon domain-containing protein [Pyrinomonadaceae bacterium]|nr:zinc ribbon domain-containing protein [Pyrinomonadaceae bacterium]
MFCPECGSDNDADKKYCSNCGQPLSVVRLALDGRVDAAIKMSDGEQRLKTYRVRLGIGVFLILVGLLTIFTGGRIGFSNVQSAALVLILMMIFFIHMSRKSHRIARALDSDDRTLGLERANSDAASIRAANPAVLKQAPNDSITDHETIKLNRPERL